MGSKHLIANKRWSDPTPPYFGHETWFGFCRPPYRVAESAFCQTFATCTWQHINKKLPYTHIVKQRINIKPIYYAVAVASLSLAGCQTGTVSYQSAILADSVSVTDATVETLGTTMELSATDCKRVIEDDSPAASLALDKLKAKTAQNGFNAIHSITVGSKGAAALLSNCWSQIKASGIAYNK